MPLPFPFHIAIQSGKESFKYSKLRSALMFRSLRRWKSASLRAGPNRRMLSTARGTAVGSGRSKVALLGAAAASTMGVALAVSALKSPAKADSAKPASPAPATPPPLASDGYQPETATVRRLKTTREIKERFDSFASKELEGQKIMTVRIMCYHSRVSSSFLMFTSRGPSVRWRTSVVHYPWIRTIQTPALCSAQRTSITTAQYRWRSTRALCRCSIRVTRR